MSYLVYCLLTLGEWSPLLKSPCVSKFSTVLHPFLKSNCADRVYVCKSIFTEFSCNAFALLKTIDRNFGITVRMFKDQRLFIRVGVREAVAENEQLSRLAKDTFSLTPQTVKKLLPKFFISKSNVTAFAKSRQYHRPLEGNILISALGVTQILII